MTLHPSKTHICASELASPYFAVLLYREQREHRVFCALLKSIPGLEEKLMSVNSEEDIQSIAAMVSLFIRGSARSLILRCLSASKRSI